MKLAAFIVKSIIIMVPRNGKKNTGDIRMEEIKKIGIKNVYKFVFDENGLRVFSIEDGKELDALVCGNIYHKDFDLQIKGRILGDDAGISIELTDPKKSVWGESKSSKMKRPEKEMTIDELRKQLFILIRSTHDMGVENGDWMRVMAMVEIFNTIINTYRLQSEYMSHEINIRDIDDFIFDDG